MTTFSPARLIDFDTNALISKEKCNIGLIDPRSHPLETSLTQVGQSFESVTTRMGVNPVFQTVSIDLKGIRLPNLLENKLKRVAMREQRFRRPGMLSTRIIIANFSQPPTRKLQNQITSIPVLTSVKTPYIKKDKIEQRKAITSLRPIHQNTDPEKYAAVTINRDVPQRLAMDQKATDEADQSKKSVVSAIVESDKPDMTSTFSSNQATTLVGRQHTVVTSQLVNSVPKPQPAISRSLRIKSNKSVLLAGSSQSHIANLQMASEHATTSRSALFNQPRMSIQKTTATAAMDHLQKDVLKSSTRPHQTSSAASSTVPNNFQAEFTNDPKTADPKLSIKTNASQTHVKDSTNDYNSTHSVNGGEDSVLYRLASAAGVYSAQWVSDESSNPRAPSAQGSTGSTSDLNIARSEVSEYIPAKTTHRDTEQKALIESGEKYKPSFSKHTQDSYPQGTAFRKSNSSTFESKPSLSHQHYSHYQYNNHHHHRRGPRHRNCRRDYVSVNQYIDTDPKLHNTQKECNTIMDRFKKYNIPIRKEVVESALIVPYDRFIEPPPEIDFKLYRKKGARHHGVTNSTHEMDSPMIGPLLNESRPGTRKESGIASIIKELSPIQSASKSSRTLGTFRKRSAKVVINMDNIVVRPATLHGSDEASRHTVPSRLNCWWTPKEYKSLKDNFNRYRHTQHHLYNERKQKASQIYRPQTMFHQDAKVVATHLGKMSMHRKKGSLTIDPTQTKAFVKQAQKAMHGFAVGIPRVLISGESCEKSIRPASTDVSIFDTFSGTFDGTQSHHSRSRSEDRDKRETGVYLVSDGKRDFHEGSANHHRALWNGHARSATTEPKTEKSKFRNTLQGSTSADVSRSRDRTTTMYQPSLNIPSVYFSGNNSRKSPVGGISQGVQYVQQQFSNIRSGFL
ncbi:hypothetical protein QVD99_001702 [Batrachochytrium dendrobatidis]|nr:hypothetical protein QVD99_001702 [Batrachochytrium dendrobatidis]